LTKALNMKFEGTLSLW